MSQRANIELLHCDCMDYMAGCKDNEFDLAIVDPPYGIGAGKMTMGRGSGNDTGKFKHKDWDSSVPSVEYFFELERTSKDRIVWGGNYYNLNSTRCYIIWDKLDYNSDFAAAELAWTSFDKVVKIFKHPRNSKESRIHPTQKPVALYKWLLTNYAKPGDRILDTHLGSGSIAIACWDLGFDLVGCEIDKDYYDAAVKRFETHKAQLQLF